MFTSDAWHQEWRDKWRETADPSERLRWARLYWQLRTTGSLGSAVEAATILGIKEGTYRAYERLPGSSKNTKLSPQMAMRLAKKFQITWKWLLLGEGTPFDHDLPPAQKRVVEAMSAVDEEQQNALADMVERLLRRPPG